MHPGREHEHAVAQLRSRQRLGDLALDMLLAARTPVAMNDVPRHRRLQVLGNVLDEPLARLGAPIERAAAVRTARGPMLLRLVEFGRRRPSLTGLPRFLPRLLRARLGRRLLIRRHAGGGSGRHHIARHPRQLLAQHLRLFEQRKDHRRLA
jgi:hypothetical protein